MQKRFFCAIIISIHALREEGDAEPDGPESPTDQISIHALREEGDRSQILRGILPRHFYPRPPRGGRQFRAESCTSPEKFLSTPSARRATLTANGYDEYHIFLSTPSARRATQRHQPCHHAGGISIHALREEGDASYNKLLEASMKFLSTPSARRATEGAGGAGPHQQQFLSTPSARRATSRFRIFLHSGEHFYPRPPRGGRRSDWVAACFSMQFLSTPSARRATRRCLTLLSSASNFYPRPPRGGRLHRSNVWKRSTHISIHALREEGDRAGSGERRRSYNISIHALREEGDTLRERPRRISLAFLSTPSARRATCACICLHASGL